MPHHVMAIRKYSNMQTTLICHGVYLVNVKTLQFLLDTVPNSRREKQVEWITLCSVHLEYSLYTVYSIQSTLYIKSVTKPISAIGNILLSKNPRICKLALFPGLPAFTVLFVFTIVKQQQKRRRPGLTHHVSGH